LPLTLESGFNEAKARWIDEFEKQYLTCLMRETRGNVTRAALRAGKERRALGKLLSKHGIQRGDYTE
jgi:DNA-binding protein Fis